MNSRPRIDVGPDRDGPTIHEPLSGPGVVGAARDDAPLSLVRDTIRLPEGDEPREQERVVRPALAVLFRLAVGPGADFYTPRFLAYERSGRGRPGWNWPALLLPPVWAFYRKLWGTGIAYAFLPLLGAVALNAIGPLLESSTLGWLALAALLIWVMPSLIASLFANTLLYRRVRRLIRRTEATSESAAQTAAIVSESPTTPPGVALLLGGGMLMLALGGSTPFLSVAWHDHAVRSKLGESLAAVRMLELEVEKAWADVRQLPKSIERGVVLPRAAANLIDTLTVNPSSGRVRLILSASVPELWGKSILLVPAIDASERLRWLCVPVDIPERYLPKICRDE